MAIAISFLYRDRSYYYESDGVTPFFVDKNAAADLVIEDLSVALSVSFLRGGILIKAGASSEVVALLDQFVILDDAAQLAVYATGLSKEERRVRLPGEFEWLVGRRDKRSATDQLNQIVIGLPFISSAHCRIIRKNGIITVLDDGSKNGVFLNGKRVRNAPLQQGDVLSVFTLQIMLSGEFLIFKNTGDKLKIRQTERSATRKAAPKKSVRAENFLFSRSPRMLTNVESREITLEKPPQSNGTPKINWLNILVTPAITVLLMLVMVLALGMSAVMLIMSGTMSVVSAIIAVLNYRKQKAQHQGMESLVDQKYHGYLDNIAIRIGNNKKKQLSQLVAANPTPAVCLSYAENTDRRLWERSVGDQDFLSVRIGIGAVRSALRARYKQQEVVISESPLELAAKNLAEQSLWIENAPILCDLVKGKRIGIVGNRSDEVQLIRNMLVSIATAHAYDEVKVILFASEDEISTWEWARWLPHCADHQGTGRYLFTSVEDADETLDAINDILNRRTSKGNDYSRGTPVDNTPHYVFVALQRQIIERHPVRKHLFSDEDNGCSCLFAYDSITYLPKECNEIIEVHNGGGEIYDRHNASVKTKFLIDKLSLENADAFARAMAPLQLRMEGQAGALPKSISFLEGYGVSRPEQLEIAERWSRAKVHKTLSVPIAAAAGGDPFFFDIHEKCHGVNGVVAGMPGSGKTEMVQTWLLSLAVNYSPQDVSLVLIDFKGAGLIAPFRNLPHLAGSISNLDSSIDRNLIAIQSEVHRREALIDKYSDKSIKNINDLNKAYEKGLVPEKLPVLLIVIDEYAEFKKIFPDFGAEIDSLTSKGRALGMFVVLMTQKPAGVVSAKSEDNIKFRWCLRVANYSASREMLGRGDAARIANPGRAYIKVGEDDVYEQVQSYWSGAPYVPDKARNKKSDCVISLVRLDGKMAACEQRQEKPAGQSNEAEIDAVIRHIADFCRQHQIAPAEKIWTEKLPETVALEQILRNRFTPEKGWPETGDTAPAVGLVDDPEKQTQYPLVLDFAKLGHVMVYGAPVSGKTTFLQTLIMSVAMSCRPNETSIYAMDFGGWNLNILKDLPHVGGIANDNEPDRIRKLVALLTDTLEARKAAFSAVGVGNIRSYREATGKNIPDVILVVDNFGSAMKLYPDLDMFFGLLTGSGANYGVYLVATAVASNAVPLRIAQNIKYALALQLIDRSEYTYTVGKVSSEVPTIAGRGYAKGKPPLMFQTALPAPGTNEKEMAVNIRNTAAAMNTCWTGNRAMQIPTLPAVIPYGSVKLDGVCLGLSVDKVMPVGVDFSAQHFLMISGMPQSGKTNLLGTIAKQLKHSVGGALYVLDAAARMPQSVKSVADKYFTTASEIDAFIEALRPELQKRLEKKQKDPSTAFDAITFVIDNYSQFFQQVSNETIARLLAIIKLGKELALRLVVACDAYELTSLVNKGEVCALSMVRSDYAVMLGGSMNDHAAIKTQSAYAQKSETVDEYEGYWVQKMNCIRFKAMNHLGE